MSKTLNVIKRDIALLTLDIECLDPASKYTAIVHLEEAINLLKIGAEHDLAASAIHNLSEEKQETKLKDDWMFNNDTFIDESNNETFPVQEKEHRENENTTGQELLEEKVLNQIPNNEVKPEPVNQEPVVISWNPDAYYGQVANENNMLKCDLCNVYLPRSYTLKRHEEEPQHLARVSTVQTAKHVEEKSPEKNLKVSKSKTSAHICNICQKQYRGRKDLLQHKNMHTERYKCQKCKEPFSRRSRLERHNRNPENCLKIAKIRSSISVPSANKITIKYRIKKETTTSNEESFQDELGMNFYQCPECPNQYNKKNSLMVHRVMHTGKYKCQKCKETFQSRSKLEKHINNPNSCLILKKIRASRNDIITRKSIKIDACNQQINEKKPQPEFGLKVFRCHECPNQYNNKESLMRHKIIHTGKYKCPRCEAPFIRRSKLDIHTRDPDNCRKLQKIRSSNQFLSVEL